jgi:hypothetical protein
MIMVIRMNATEKRVLGERESWCIIIQNALISGSLPSEISALGATLIS